MMPFCLHLPFLLTRPQDMYFYDPKRTPIDIWNFIFLVFLSLTFYWDCFQLNNSWESIIKTGSYCHRVTKCSWGNITLAFFFKVGCLKGFLEFALEYSLPLCPWTALNYKVYWYNSNILLVYLAFTRQSSKINLVLDHFQPFKCTS